MKKIFVAIIIFLSFSISVQALTGYVYCPDDNEPINVRSSIGGDILGTVSCNSTVEILNDSLVSVTFVKDKKELNCSYLFNEEETELTISNSKRCEAENTFIRLELNGYDIVEYNTDYQAALLNEYDAAVDKGRDILEYVIAWLGSLGMSLGVILLAVLRIKKLLGNNFPKYEKMVKNNLDILSQDKKLQETLKSALENLAGLSKEVIDLKSQIEAYNLKTETRDKNIDNLINESFKSE